MDPTPPSSPTASSESRPAAAAGPARAPQGGDSGSAPRPTNGAAGSGHGSAAGEAHDPHLEGHMDAQMKAAMETAMSAAPEVGRGGRQDKGALAAGGGSHKPAIRGPRVVQAGREHRTATVVSVGPSDVFLEFGPKELGVAPRLQWSDEELPKVGSQLEVVVERFEPGESLFVCSRPGVVQKAAWEFLEVGQTVEARVTGVNKGGLDLEVAGHRAFMPASQASLERVADPSVFVGQKWACKVSQLDKRGRGNIVLSRRDVLEAEREEQAKKLREAIKEGDVLEGTVRKIMPFGVFVDLGGIDGLVHMSDLTYDRINYGEQAVAKHVKEGQQVRVKVLKADWEAGRLSLGMKQLAADPFQTAMSDVKEGAELTGRVTRLTDFGAFIEITSGVEGLVHVSEIAWRRIGKPADVLKTDEVVKVKVLKIDPDSRKISLSIKALQPAPEPMAGPGGKAGPKGKDRPGRTAEEIMKETPALRRLREKFGKSGFKGGLS
ncbi:MAG: S1 RNA-binding domain-containing protein [Phycisphaerales bacterium]|nr:S1 RNA-binding domain-containing protein [Phycisphaerales bacterium]